MVECAGRCDTPRADIDRAPMPENVSSCTLSLYAVSFWTFQWFHLSVVLWSGGLWGGCALTRYMSPMGAVGQTPSNPPWQII